MQSPGAVVATWLYPRGNGDSRCWNLCLLPTQTAQTLPYKHLVGAHWACHLLHWHQLWPIPHLVLWVYLFWGMWVIQGTHHCYTPCYCSCLVVMCGRTVVGVVTPCEEEPVVCSHPLYPRFLTASLTCAHDQSASVVTCFSNQPTICCHCFSEQAGKPSMLESRRYSAKSLLFIKKV